MDKTEQIVLTNMCMVYRGNEILVQNRLNPGWPGIACPGGHVEMNESFTESVIREIKEETGLDITDVHLCGIKQFSRKNERYRYIVLLYKTDKFSGTLRSSEEGEVFWTTREALKEMKLADGFEEMLRVMTDDTLSEVYLLKDGENRIGRML